MISPIVSKHSKQVQLVNRIYDGIDTAEAEILQYEKEDDAGYKNRLQLARLTNFVAMAIDSIAQIVMRKPIDTAELNPKILEFTETIDYQNDINYFATELLFSTAKDGLSFILIDKDAMAEGATKRDADQIRPYLVHIVRSRVKSWKTDTHGNITSFVYDEDYVSAEGFVDEIKVQQRAFRIDEDGTVLCEIYRDDVMVECVASELDRIPVVMIEDGYIPRFYDLARINKNHLNLMSEFRENIRKLIIIPIVWDGTSNSDKLQVSTTTGIKFTGTPSECDFQYRSPDSAFLTAQKEAIEAEEQTARLYIAEMFENTSNKTATEVGIIQSKNEAVFNHFATLVEDGLNKCLEIMGEYENIDSVGLIKINRDYISSKLSEGQISQLRDDFVNGAISHELYLKTLVKGEIYDLTDDEIDEQVERAVLS